MIEERAVILSLENRPNGYPDATLEIERKTACGLCGQTRGCGNSLWGKLFAHKSSAFKAQNSINAKVGDSVVIGINEAALVKSALLLYIVPLVTMLIGAILATQIHDTNGYAMLGAAIGLVLGFVWVKGHTMSSSYFNLQQPVILRLVFEETVVKFGL
jgi:sigma-E factor negative regulatory protein RseC